MGLGDFFSSGGHQQTSSSSSHSGFSTGDKDTVSGFSRNRLFGLSEVAEDMVRNQALPQFQFSEKFPGLFKQQEGFADAFAKQLFSGVSGSAAARGQLTPFNVPGIVGSALTKAAPALLPMIGQNLQTAMVVPETIRTQRFNNALSPLQALVAGLGSQSSQMSSGQSAGPGLGYVGAGSFLKGFGGGLGEALGSGGGSLGGIVSGLF